ncbi:Mitochondrial import inner membrane translocase subunit Tim21, partial [Chytridiales sp. JEL 0842]
MRSAKLTDYITFKMTLLHRSSKGWCQTACLAARCVPLQHQQAQTFSGSSRAAAEKMRIGKISPAARATAYRRKPSSWSDMTFGEKVVEGGKNAGYLTFIVGVLGVIGFSLTFLGGDVVEDWRVNKIYEAAFSHVKENELIQQLVGTPMQGFGDQGPRGKGTKVSRHIIQDRTGAQKSLMRFYVKGPKEKGTVNVTQVRNAEGDWEFLTIFVDVPARGGPGSKKVTVLDNRIKPERPKRKGLVLGLLLSNSAHALVFGPAGRTLAPNDALDPLGSFGYYADGEIYFNFKSVNITQKLLTPLDSSPSAPKNDPSASLFVYVCPQSLFSVQKVINNPFTFNSTFCGAVRPSGCPVSSSLPELGFVLPTPTVKLPGMGNSTQTVGEDNSLTTSVPSSAPTMAPSGSEPAAYEYQYLWKTPVEVKRKVAMQDVHDIFFVNCNTNASAAILFVGSFENPGLWIIRHLSVGNRQNLIVFVAYSGIWLVLCLIWLLQPLGIRIKTPPNKLYNALGLIPLTSLGYCLYMVALYCSLGSRGIRLDALETGRFIMVVFQSTSLTVCQLLMAKGWGIVRFHLAPVEKRTIAGVSLFYALSDIFYQSIGNGAVIGLQIFGMTAYAYMFWSTHDTIRTLTVYIKSLKDRLPNPPPPPPTPPPSSSRFAALWKKYTGTWHLPEPNLPPQTPKITSMGTHWNLIHVYECKLWMMHMITRLLALYAVLTFAGKFFEYTRSTNASVSLGVVNLVGVVGLWGADMSRAAQERAYTLAVNIYTRVFKPESMLEVDKLAVRKKGEDGGEGGDAVVDDDNEEEEEEEANNPYGMKVNRLANILTNALYFGNDYLIDTFAEGHPRKVRRMLTSIVQRSDNRVFTPTRQTVDAVQQMARGLVSSFDRALLADFRKRTLATVFWATLPPIVFMLRTVEERLHGQEMQYSDSVTFAIAQRRVFGHAAFEGTWMAPKQKKNVAVFIKKAFTVVGLNEAACHEFLSTPTNQPSRIRLRPQLDEVERNKRRDAIQACLEIATSLLQDHANSGRFKLEVTTDPRGFRRFTPAPLSTSSKAMFVTMDSRDMTEFFRHWQKDAEDHPDRYVHKRIPRERERDVWAEFFRFNMHPDDQADDPFNVPADDPADDLAGVQRTFRYPMIPKEPNDVELNSKWFTGTMRTDGYSAHWIIQRP